MELKQATARFAGSTGARPIPRRADATSTGAAPRAPAPATPTANGATRPRFVAAPRPVTPSSFAIDRMQVEELSVSYGSQARRSSRSRCRSARARCWR